jgi:hypothetical protein
MVGRTDPREAAVDRRMRIVELDGTPTAPDRGDDDATVSFTGGRVVVDVAFDPAVVEVVGSEPDVAGMVGFEPATVEVGARDRVGVRTWVPPVLFDAGDSRTRA